MFRAGFGKGPSKGAEAMRAVDMTGTVELHVVENG
jgi:hypothetical protein